jgi:hypothetical protein
MNSEPRFKVIKKECVLILPSHFTGQKLIEYFSDADNYKAKLEEKKKCYKRLGKSTENLKISIASYPAMAPYGNNIMV